MDDLTPEEFFAGVDQEFEDYTNRQEEALKTNAEYAKSREDIELLTVRTLGHEEEIIEREIKHNLLMLEMQKAFYAKEHPDNDELYRRAEQAYLETLNYAKSFMEKMPS